MTYTHVTKTANGHNISIRQEAFSEAYRVRDYDIKAQRTDSERIYPTMQKAKARYNALVRKYK